MVKGNEGGTTQPQREVHGNFSSLSPVNESPVNTAIGPAVTSPGESAMGWRTLASRVPIQGGWRGRFAAAHRISRVCVHTPKRRLVVFSRKCRTTPRQ